MRLNVCGGLTPPLLMAACLAMFVVGLVWPGSSVAAGPGQYGAPDWWPLRGSNLIGCARNSPGPICGGDYHPVWAIDVEAPQGQAIYASGAGLAKVYSNTTACTGYGKAVVVEHGGATKSLYGHMSNFSAALNASPGGVWVDENTVIGYVGHTGNVSNCSYNHLHYEETTSGVFWASASDPGALKACNGASLVTYPGQWGRASWNALPAHTFTARNDGTGCTAPPIPPPPPDQDGDGFPDSSDVCPSHSGAFYGGCPDEIGQPQPTSRADFNGDGRADYCRRVGGRNNVDSFVACTVSTGSGFGSTVTSGLLDWGYEFGRAWADANGDGRADYCRAVGGTNLVESHVACTLSTGSGFGTTITSPVIDYGYETARTWVDFDGDGRADYCRRVGGANNVSSFLACTLSTGAGFGSTVQSAKVDWGYEFGRAWVDFNGDGRADYCRLVGGANNVASHAACTLSAGAGFGVTITSPVIDYGYDAGRRWVDFNGDGRADYCRRVGGANNVDSFLSCTLSAGDAFGSTLVSPKLDWGYATGRAWADFNGDGRADYCRLVGGTNLVDSYAACTLSAGWGFGATVSSPVIDYGYDTGRAWVDANGDEKADYCRLVGGVNNQSSHISCTLSGGTAFTGGIMSTVVDWGFPTDRVWAGEAYVRPKAVEGPGGTPSLSDAAGPASLQKPAPGVVGASRAPKPRATFRSLRKATLLRTGLRGTITGLRASRCAVRVTHHGRLLGASRPWVRRGSATFSITFGRTARRTLRRHTTTSVRFRAACGQTRLTATLRLK